MGSSWAVAWEVYFDAVCIQLIFLDQARNMNIVEVAAKLRFIAAKASFTDADVDIMGHNKCSVITTQTDSP